MILVCVILWLEVPPPSSMRAAVDHLSLNDPSLTTIYVPFSLFVALCLSIVWEAW